MNDNPNENWKTFFDNLKEEEPKVLTKEEK